MAELPQYPTSEQIKEALDAHSKGKEALGEYLDKAAAERKAAKAELENGDVSEGNRMTQDMKNDEDQCSESFYIVTYRNKEDDPIRLAWEEAAERLTAQGKPLFHPKED